MKCNSYAIKKILHHLNFDSGASGAGEIARALNGATALQNTPNESIDNETITWNWNPQASSKLNFESKCDRPIDNTNGHVAYKVHSNCYGLKRNRNSAACTDEASSASASASTANGKNLSIWCEDPEDGTDMKNSNFWSKVLFNTNSNNNYGCSSGSGSNSSSGNSSKDQRRTNNLCPSASNTAVIFNSIISNLKDQYPKNIDLSDMDAIDRNFNMSSAIVQNSAGDGSGAPVASGATTSMLPSSTGSDSSYHSKSKNSSQKNKSVKHRSEQSNIEAADGVFRLSLDNDLNAANSTFLRALNDLHLDYNDLTGGTTSAQSKERYVMSNKNTRNGSNTNRPFCSFFCFFSEPSIDQIRLRKIGILMRRIFF